MAQFVASFNRVQVQGRLGKDVDVKVLPAGQTVATVSVATEVNRKGQDGNYTKVTQWFNVSFWPTDAQQRFVDQYVKGTMVSASGELYVREYTNKDGEVKTSMDIQADWISFPVTTVNTSSSNAVEQAPRQQQPARRPAAAPEAPNPWG